MYERGKHMQDYYRRRFTRYTGGTTPEEAYPSKIGIELDETVKEFVDQKEQNHIDQEVDKRIQERIHT